MTERSIAHGTFVVERTYPASPARVFAAWADPKIKARWFGESAGKDMKAFEFKIGGRESHSGKTGTGQDYRADALYQDIIPDERIIYTYDMHLDDKRISVSLASIELEPEGAGTRMTVTEHGAFLDGLDTPAQREFGTSWLMDRLGEELARQS